MKSNSKTWLGGLIVLVVVVAVVAALVEKHNNGNRGPKGNSADSNNVAYNNYTLEGNDETPADQTQPSVGSSSQTWLSYDQALKTYGPPPGNNYRFQFGANCQITPSSLAIKRNNKFMIDNRDSVAHTIAVGKQSYRLNKYGFAIVTASALGSLDVKCDGINRGKLTVEK